MKKLCLMLGMSMLWSSNGVFAAQTASIDEVALRVAMEDVLKDSESARFRNLDVFEDPYLGDGQYTLCGEVNAKNSYGAYIGYKPFMARSVTLPTGEVVYEGISTSEWIGEACKIKQEKARQAESN